MGIGGGTHGSLATPVRGVLSPDETLQLPPLYDAENFFYICRIIVQICRSMFFINCFSY